MSQTPRPRRRIAGERPPAATPPPKKPTVARRPVRPPSGGRGGEAVAPSKAERDRAVTAPPAKPKKPAVKKPAKDASAGKPAARGGSGPKAAAQKPLGPGPRRPAPSAWTPRLLIAAALALVLLGAGGYLTYTGVGDYRFERDRLQAEEQAVTAAQEAIEAIMTFRSDRIEELEENSRRYLSGGSGERFEQFLAGLQQLAEARTIQVDAATVNAAAVECGQSCRPGRVDVLLFVNLAVQVEGEGQPEVRRQRMIASMREVGNDWRIDDVEIL